MITDYDSLTEQIGKYMHRTDLAGQYSTFVQLAENRIYRELVVPEMYATINVQPTTDIFDLPEGYQKLRTITCTRGNNTYALKSVGRHLMARLSQDSGTQPMFYSVAGDTIEVQPNGADNEFTIDYFRRFEPLSLVGTNDVLSAYPSIYLYAALVEGGAYTQDGELMTGADQKYQQLVIAANEDAEAGRFGESPQITVG